MGRALLARALVLGVILLESTAGFAQTALDHDSGAWGFLFARKKLSGILTGQVEVSPRIGQDFSRLQSILLRPSLIVEFHPNLSASVGYLAMLRWNELGDLPTEHRVWEQLQGNFKAGPVLMIPRLRLEHRVREGATTNELAHRIRAMVRSVLPVYKPDPEVKAPTISVVLFDELFVQLNSVPNWTDSGFDQNRLFAGINLGFNPKVSLELGYMNQFVRIAVPQALPGQNAALVPNEQLRMNHLIITNLTAEFD